ncbi:MAG: DUF2179 domain-containing protein [Longimicrobiales bacterium]
MPQFDAIFAGAWGPIIIFALRLFDVSLSTIRILLAVRNRRVLVPIIGFFEVLIWVFAAGNAIRHLESVWHVLGYAAGFSTGTLVGLWIEEKLAIGIATMRVVTKRTGAGLAEGMRQLGCGVTELIGQGRHGAVEVLFSVVPRRRIPDVIAEVERWDPDAFITVEEPREIRRGWMHSTPRLRLQTGLSLNEWAQKLGRRRSSRS